MAKKGKSIVYKGLFQIAMYLCAFLALFFLPNALHAASLELSPPTGSYVVGDTIAVDVFVDTGDNSMNAVSGELIYDGTQLRAQSVSHSNSIVDLWVEEPAVLGTNRVAFEGILLNPGFTGKGKVITIRFLVTGSGDGVGDISFTSGLVLKNDGFGTNVLNTLSGAHFSLFETTSTRSGEQRLPLEDDVNQDGENGLLAPTIISYTEKPIRYSDLFVRGVTYPNAEVNVFFQSEDGDIEEHVITSDSGGNFSYIYADSVGQRQLAAANPFVVMQALAQPLVRKEYTMWLTAVYKGVETEATQPLPIVVGGFLSILPIFIIILLLIGLVVSVYLVYESRKHTHQLKNELQKRGR